MFSDWLGALPFGDDSRPAAVLVLFGVLDDVAADRGAAHRAVSTDLDVLLLARAQTLRSHAGQVAFPGGRIDPGDRDVVDAALREAVEETGLDRAGVDVLGTLPELPLPFSSHRVTPVLGWWARPTPVGVVDERESSSVFRVPVAELLDPAERFSTRIRRAGETMTGPGWRVGPGRDQLLWGFTAGVLDRMFSALGWAEPWDTERFVEL
nr:CoA pyrophosphatase [Microbacterium halophytorum]